MLAKVARTIHRTVEETWLKGFVWVLFSPPGAVIETWLLAGLGPMASGQEAESRERLRGHPPAIIAQS